jgi:hypothetical protein
MAEADDRVGDDDRRNMLEARNYQVSLRCERLKREWRDSSLNAKILRHTKVSLHSCCSNAIVGFGHPK